METKEEKLWPYGLGLIGVLIVLFFVLCFRTVGAGQVGVVTRFGNVSREAQSGIVLKLPWPIEHLTKMNVQVQKEDITADAASADLQDAHATLAVNYHLERGRARDVFKNIGTKYKERIILPLVQTSFKAQTTNYTASELLTKRVQVEQATLESVRKQLAPKGITVDAVSVVNFGFSKEFTDAIEQKQVAQQDAEKAHFAIQREQSYAQAAVEKAKGEAQAAIEVARGQAESQRLIQESVTGLTIQKQAVDKWNGVLPTYWGAQGSVFSIPFNSTK